MQLQEEISVLFLCPTTPGPWLRFGLCFCMGTPQVSVASQVKGRESSGCLGTLPYPGWVGGWQAQLGCGWNGYSCTDQQALATDWDKLILRQVPPHALRGRSWCVGVMVAPPSHNPRHWLLTCQGNYLPSGAFLAVEPLAPGPTAVSVLPAAVLSLGLLNPVP